MSYHINNVLLDQVITRNMLVRNIDKVYYEEGIRYLIAHPGQDTIVIHTKKGYHFEIDNEDVFQWILYRYNGAIWCRIVHKEYIAMQHMFKTSEEYNSFLPSEEKPISETPVSNSETCEPAICP
jgi:hypothetical protein